MEVEGHMSENFALLGSSRQFTKAWDLELFRSVLKGTLPRLNTSIVIKRLRIKFHSWWLRCEKKKKKKKR